MIDQVNKVIYNGVEFVSGTQWIPCSERLPEKGTYVICSQDNGDVGEGKFVGDDEWFICYDQMYRGAYWVKAWMPLPEPYKEEEDGCVHQ